MQIFKLLSRGILLVNLLLLSMLLSAQNGERISVSGTVVQAGRQPVQNVSVSVNNSVMAVTGEDGKYNKISGRWNEARMQINIPLLTNSQPSEIEGGLIIE